MDSSEESREARTSAFTETNRGFALAALASATPFLTWLVAEPLFVPLVASFAAEVTCTHGDAKVPFPHLTRDDDAPCYGTAESVNRATSAVVVAVVVAPAVGAYFFVKVAPRLDPLAVEQPWHALARLSFKWFLAAFTVLHGEGDMTRHEPRGDTYGVPSGSHRGYPSDGHAARDEAHLFTLASLLAFLYALNFHAQPVRGAGLSRRMNAARGACFASAFWVALLAFFVTTRASAPVGSGAVSASRETANETSSVENLASSPVEEEKEEEEEEGEASAKNEEIEFSALHPRTNDDAFPAFASVDIDDEDVDAALDDHRFKETPATGPADLPAWSKAVRKEWRTLRTSLPANVWVRVFEQRTDVLRAAMLGPEGTPYHDNIFVFDFSFPPGYPNEPPASSYHSRGERVNPNLYENGKVCLSLLSTWSGKGSEMWDPKRSNMLQVLVSIQGLVLVDDPYYNEAGYEKQSGTAEGKRNGDQYNEQAFLASARSMISTVRDPPRHFEPLIRAHFHARAPKILRVCRAYLDEGCPIGQYDARLVSENVSADAGGSGTTGKADAAAEPPSRSASQSSGSEKKAPSRPPPTEGFKLTLRKLVPKLEAAFKANDELVDASERGERART